MLHIFFIVTVALLWPLKPGHTRTIFAYVASTFTFLSSPSDVLYLSLGQSMIYRTQDQEYLIIYFCVSIGMGVTTVSPIIVHSCKIKQKLGLGSGHDCPHRRMLYGLSQHNTVHSCDFGQRHSHFVNFTEQLSFISWALSFV